MGADGARSPDSRSIGTAQTAGLVTCYVGLGSNLGDRLAHLQHAVRLLKQQPVIHLGALSTIRETNPVGGPPQGRYLNCVVEIQTDAAPAELLRLLKRIEREMGRPANDERWGPRIIDLDLLFHGDRTIHSPTLTIPHPLLHERRFVLEPLAQLAPSLMHPVLHKTIAELLAALPAS